MCPFPLWLTPAILSSGGKTTRVGERKGKEGWKEGGNPSGREEIRGSECVEDCVVNRRKEEGAPLGIDQIGG